MDAINCSTCKLWRSKTKVKGKCCRHAPTDKGFPTTYSTTFCGDWLSKEKKDEKKS